MKSALLLIALAYPLAVTNASILQRRPFGVSTKKETSTSSFLDVPVPRGGDIGPITGKALAKTIGVGAIGDAITGTAIPVSAWSKFKVDVEPGSKGEHYLGHGMGASAATLAVTSLLALTGTTSVNEAIGYGILTRCAYMTEMLLTHQYKKLDVPTAPHIVIYLILLVTAFGLLSGTNSDYVELAKVVSIVLAGHGALLFINPRIEEDERMKKMASVDGGYMFCASLFAALLAFGVDPVKAMGYTSIAIIPLFLAVLDLVAANELFGLSKEAWTLVMISFVGVSAYGMLV